MKIHLNNHLAAACCKERARFRKLFGTSAAINEKNLRRWVLHVLRRAGPHQAYACSIISSQLQRWVLCPTASTYSEYLTSLSRIRRFAIKQKNDNRNTHHAFEVYNYAELGATIAEILHFAQKRDKRTARVTRPRR